MKKFVYFRILPVLCAAILLFSPVPAAASGVFVAPVEGLSGDFLFSADVSSVLSEENSGVVYYDENGSKADLFALLAGAGFRAVRVRVWVDPYDAQGNAYGGGNCDLNNACEIGRRAAEAGLQLIVDFHYSDFWADPKKQMCPKAWEGMTVDEKAAALRAYTRESLQAMLDAGADIAMVQIGNETDNGLAGETNWNDIAALMRAGSRAVRETAPGALVATHFSKPDARYARLLWARNVDYDVYAVSYYPFWHGTLENLETVLQSVAADYGKQTFIAETSYLYTEDNGDQQPNSVPAAGAALPYAATVQGQANALRAVTQSAVNGGALGWCYWEPAWLPVPGDTYEEQSALWEQFGSGWASSFAGSYDPKDAGLYWGGSSWDNQALFAFTGHPLATLNFPWYAYAGSTAPRAVDGYQTANALGFAGSPIAMPATVDAVYNDGTTEPVAVAWDAAQVAAAEASGAGMYTIDGTANGAPVTCTLTVTADNYLRNPGFEDTDMRMWAVENLGGTDELTRKESLNDIKSGKALFHFYDTGSAEFTIEQTVTGLAPGSYTFSLYIMGGDAKEQTMYIYVKRNGEIYATAGMGITKWQEWQHPTIDAIPVGEDGTITIGAYVKCTDSGPWGKLDDWMLSKTR